MGDRQQMYGVMLGLLSLFYMIGLGAYRKNVFKLVEIGVFYVAFVLAYVVWMIL